MYMQPGDASARLLTVFDIDAFLTIGDVFAASLDLDDLAPFKGDKTNPDQLTEFPRDGDTVVPDAILDWVVLRAYMLARDEPEGVTRQSIGRLSSEHSPSYSREARMLPALIAPYLERTARV